MNWRVNRAIDFHADYIKDKAAPYFTIGDTWAEVAVRVEDDGDHDLADWVRYYFVPGM